MEELKIKVLNKIKELRNIYKVKDFDIVYNLNSHKVIGCVVGIRYFYKTGKLTLKLNEQLLKEYGDLYINEVVVHEFGHIVINNIYPSGYNGLKKINTHGKEWKRVCKKLGLTNPKATTNLVKNSEYINSIRKRTMHEYKCGCSTNNIHYLSTIRHNRIKRGESEYKCVKCHQILTEIIYK